MQEWQVAELFEQIKVRYDNFITNREKRQAWYEDRLKDIPLEDALTNLRRHATNEKFPPTLADLCRPLEPDKDYSAEYHEGMKALAEQHLANLDEWSERAVGPTPEQLERVRAAFAKRSYGHTVTGES